MMLDQSLLELTYAFLAGGFASTTQHRQVAANARRLRILTTNADSSARDN